MAIMFPDSLPEPLTEYLRGEAKVFEALKTQLDKNWVVFANVNWHTKSSSNKQRDGETDFIVSHPEYGILVLEVKGGMQIVYHPEEDAWASIDLNMEGNSIKNPYEQARKYRYQVLDNLRHTSELGRVDDLESLINVGYAVVFPDVSRISSGSLPSYASLDITAFEHDVRNHIGKRLIQIMKHYSSGSDKNALLIQESHKLLKHYLAPQFTLDRSLKLWFDDEEQQIITLTENQYYLLDVLRYIKQASIYGCAGSGKTLLAMKKAELSALNQEQTLLLCFNNILGKHFVKHTHQIQNLTAGNFHAVLLDLIRTQTNQSFDIYNDQEISDLILSLDLPKYDVILIDEAQDFAKEQIEIIRFLLKEDGVIYYFWDSNQRVIRRDEYIPKDIPKFSLDTNLRNTEYIFKAVNDHYNQDLQLKHKGPQGRPIQEWEKYNPNDPQDLYRKLRSILNHLIINEEIKPEDITILTFKAKSKSDLINFTYDKAKLSLFVDDKEENAVQIDTVRRFKGMENKVIIVTEMNDEYVSSHPELYDDMCYVSFSRAKNHLVIMSTIQ